MSKELTPLKALSIMHFNCREYDNLDKHYDIIENSLKALEIIKNKFRLHIVKDEKNGNFYAMVVFAYKDFPQYCIYETHDKEEYNLLKEVLL